MGIDQFFRLALRTNPTIGKFVVGGGIVVAVAALCSSWLTGHRFADGQTVLVAVAGLLAVCSVVALLAALTPRGEAMGPQRQVFSWALMLLIIAYPWLLFASVVTDGWPRPFACLSEPWRDCPSLLSGLVSQVATQPASTPASSAPTPSTPVTTRTGAVNRGAYTITVQFAGDLNRDTQAKPLTSALHNLGWFVPDWEEGGERTGKAAGYVEVRYHGPEQRAAAELLSLEVQKSVSLLKPVVPIQASAVRPNSLEAWISR